MYISDWVSNCFTDVNVDLPEISFHEDVCMRNN